MKYLFWGESNYDKFPFIKVDGFENECFTGWTDIACEIKNYCKKIAKQKIVIVAECYTGIYDTVADELQRAINPEHFFNTNAAFKTTQEVDRMVFPDVTDDEVFGFLTKLNLADFFNEMKLSAIWQKIFETSKGTILVVGPGATMFAPRPDLKLYFDMPRWEAQLRFRRDEVSNLGADNKTEKASLQYKRAFFVDWRVCDKHKKNVMPNCDLIIDTVVATMPKMITQKAFRQGLSKAVDGPFRVVPFFDPGPWGGQWMKEVCDLDKEAENYAWCFDCVPEENSLMFKFGDILFETPAINMVFFKPIELLGTAVYGRFGDEFPIRFDFLDTMGGGNLSLQVHPLTEYIQEKFGFPYTQDESYYLMETGKDACVYLGLKEDIAHGEMISDLKASTDSGMFDAERYVEKWKVKKHDHLLIPAGTVHCSGANSMVLEISATPYIFTFKLWDWDRMGLDGKPRPINIDHGEKQIHWERTTKWTKDNLVNQIETITEGDGWKEEKTGLHEYEFIETRRHWFSKKVTHSTNGGVNVLNLVEGAEVIVESETGQFEPFVVHYAETFIIPASVKRYTIRPYGKSEGKDCATIKAFVRNKA